MTEQKADAKPAPAAEKANGAITIDAKVVPPAKAPDGKPQPNPGNAKPGNAKPPSPKPANPQPANVKPANPKPAATKPASSKPPSPKPTVVEVRPFAQAARMRGRHWGLIASFVLVVLLPVAVSAWYLRDRAVDQYASTTAFSVRSEEGGGASDVLSGIVQFAGAGGTGVDSDILNEFIQSQEMIRAIDARLDLRAMYSRHHERDPIFTVPPDATIEDLASYWNRVVRVAYDQGAGLIDLRVLAFEPTEARAVAQAIVAESQDMINALNATAQADLRRYAEQDLEEAVERLKAAREALTQFRTRTQIVDPTADLQGQMGVVNNLQQQLAEALIEFDLLSEQTGGDDPRITQARRRIEVIRDRIARERQSFAVDEVAGIGADYPTLLSEFESLSVDRQFAEQSYTAALAALDVARDRASRQSRYLAAYIAPTLAERAEYPRRTVLLGLIALFLTLAWAIMALVWYSIRDRR